MTELIQKKLIIPIEMLGKRIDVVLAELMPEYSRGVLQEWIKSGQLTINDQIAKPKYKVQGGEQINIDVIVAGEQRWQAQAINLDIIYEDEFILLVNKSADMVVNPGAGNPDGTLVNALLHHCPSLDALPRAGIVHRIDKQTSGILVVAKNLIAHNALVKQLQDKSMFRQYKAICVGNPKVPFSVDAPIARHPTQRTRMAVVERGKPAVTHISIEEHFSSHALISAQLETGRTHQIRVHMTYKGYPLVGDPVYGGKPKFPKGCTESLREALIHFKRQALHAESLGFIHPDQQEYIEWTVPLPDDMYNLLQELRTNKQ